MSESDMSKIRTRWFFIWVIVTAINLGIGCYCNNKTSALNYIASGYGIAQIVWLCKENK